MGTGYYRWLPETGGILAQNDWLMECLQTAWYTWYINAYKPTHQIPITPEDSNFMNWLIPPDYQPPSGYNVEAVREVKAKLG